MDAELGELAEKLANLPDENLFAVLRRVLAAKHPCPQVIDFSPHRYFFGIAYGAPGSPCEISAVAFADDQHYQDGIGPREIGLCQSGTCRSCGTKAESNAKNAICGVCMASVYLT